MIIEIKIPSPGESITEVELASWFVENGAIVSKDQEIGEVESEKATLPLIAEKGGKVELLAEEGDTVKVGTVVCKIDSSVVAKETDPTIKADFKTDTEQVSAEPAKSDIEVESSSQKRDRESEITENKTTREHSSVASSEVKITPVAKKMMEEEGLSVDDILMGLRKITSKDVSSVVGLAETGLHSFKNIEASRSENRSSMSQLRKKISERLVAVKNETAMLTTFNEADMSVVMNLRKQYQDKFMKVHGVKLGFMSFFTKAVTLSLQKFPTVNSFLDGDEIVSPEYCDVGIAVQTDKGLLVPVLRNTEAMSLADIENQILEIAGRARKNRISMDELAGGTFTITNGGIFGSMLSTPILNPPQSAILGMHNILDRPVAVSGKVEIRPMMYIALSYDHRIIDGRDSVGFLKSVKDFIENPTSMLFGVNDPASVLFDL